MCIRDRYLIKSATQGAPTDTGTWVAKGAAVDTKNTTTNTDYTQDFVGDFGGNFTQDFVGNFTGNFETTFTGDFTNTFTRNSTQNFTRNSTATFTGDFTGNFASTFTGEARSLLETTSHRIQEEKMAILIQEIVGQTYGKDRFYPTFSGVLQSVNYYPVSYMKREEGVAYLALGFGRTIVDGEKCLRISPQYPNIIPQFYSIKSTRQNSQNKFYGLPLKAKDKEKEDLLLYNLKVAEKDGALKWSGSVISHEDGTIKDNLSINGSRIVSFAPVLKWETIPFSKPVSYTHLTLPTNREV